MKLLQGVKQIARNGLLADVYRHFHVNHLYGYIYSEKEVGRFIRSLKKGSRDYGYNPDLEDLYIFIGDKNLTSTMRVAVFGDVDEGNTEHDCLFYTTHVLKDQRGKRLHDAYWNANKKIPLPFKTCWESKYTTDDLKIPADKNVFLIFLGGAYFEESFSQPRFMKKLFTTPEGTFCRRILYLNDPVDKFPNIKRWMPLFDEVVTYSAEDAQHFDAHFVCTPCVKLNVPSEKPSCDVYVRLQDVNNDDRANLVRACYDYLTQRGVSCRFIVNTSKPFPSRGGVLYSEDRIPYREMVEEELSANVLLEIISAKTGNAATLRYREAVIYGRKLLTNNPYASREEFCGADGIRYFEKPEDIDVEWILDSTAPDYGYCGEYSTDAFLEKIKGICLE